MSTYLHLVFAFEMAVQPIKLSVVESDSKPSCFKFEIDLLFTGILNNYQANSAHTVPVPYTFTYLD
jgi:hypothetical protein